MPLVRRDVLGLLAACAAPGWAAAQQRRPQQALLLVGVATALFDSGMAQRLRVAVARDAGLAIQLVPGPSGKVLALLERGELDVAITHAPELEAGLEKQGLVHDRRFVASNDYLLAGPVGPKGRPELPALVGERDVLRALQAIAAAGARGEARFVSGAERSGAQLKEAALFRQAGITPQGPWYQRAGAGSGETLAQADAVRACVLVDRATWSASQQRKQLGILLQGDPRLADVYHAMRSFRSTHPAAKLFMNWLTGPLGRRALQNAPGGFGLQAPRPA